MSLYVRNFGKCIIRIKYDLGKAIGRGGYFTLGTVNYDTADVISRFTVNSNRESYQHDITCNRSTRKNDGPFSSTGLCFVSAGLLSFLGLKNDDSEKEPELITTIKRGILLTQKGELKKAEQMLHIALKLAQEQQNYDGVTYIYDLLANLAYQQGEYEKAEKLFVSVMQRLLSMGVSKTDNKMIHISLKLANIYKIRKDTRKAEEGFKFCASSLQRNMQEGQHDEDTLLLWAMTLDWYARFLVDVNRLPEAFEYFKKAYDLCMEINGVDNEEIVAVLNDLGTICFVQNDVDSALSYLTQAVAIGNKLPDMEDFGSVLINLGTVYMKKGMVQEARQVYQDAWRNAKKHNNAQVLKEANSCLDELKSSQTAQQ